MARLILLYPWISAPESPAVAVDMHGLKSWKYWILLQKWVSAIVLYPQALIKTDLDDFVMMLMRRMLLQQPL